ncbi:MAG TPA: prepilin peptidase [Desulfuromonadaceae bacterium]|nr:prepilin peptidase [Desulfuromonadaceae bacterium]
MTVNLIVLAATPLDWSLIPFHFWSLWFFVFGAMVGSFLNVCIHRMPRGLSIVTPPSHCPHCNYSIPFYLNIPLVTWLWLNGKCRNCGAPISVRYFVVELLTGVAFLGCWLEFGDQAHPLASLSIAVIYAIFLAGLIAATFIDFEHFIIPDEITLGGIVAGILISGVVPQLHDSTSHGTGFLRAMMGAAVGAGIVYFVLRLGKLLFGRQRFPLPPGSKVVFTETALHLPDKEIPFDDIFYRKSDVIVLRAETLELVDRCYRDVTVRLSPVRLEICGGTKIDEVNPNDVPTMECRTAEIVVPREAMGLGDVKFMGAIGAFVGWPGTVFSLLISSLLGSIIGLSLIALRRREWSARMPYGPYIALAAVIWLFIGKKLLEGLL